MGPSDPRSRSSACHDLQFMLNLHCKVKVTVGLKAKVVPRAPEHSCGDWSLPGGEVLHSSKGIGKLPQQARWRSLQEENCRKGCVWTRFIWRTWGPPEFRTPWNLASLRFWACRSKDRIHYQAIHHPTPTTSWWWGIHPLGGLRYLNLSFIKALTCRLS